MPIRMRLTAAFAAATLVVLAGAGLFVYLRLRADLDDAVTASIQARWVTASEQVAAGRPLSGFPLEDPEESFVQLVGADGRVLDHVGGATSDTITGDDLVQAASGTVTRELDVPGIDGPTRVLARAGPVGSSPIIVVGQSLTNRDEALADLLVSFGLGGPVAVAGASLAGYAVARAGFAPVEAMRASAAALSLTGDGGRLPVPTRADEIHRLAITLNDMIERLERSWERERRFVADASHELRTPIAVIKTELEAAASNISSTALAAESLRAAIDECDSLAQLADDLLTLSRTAEAGLPVTTEATPILTLLDDGRLRYVDRAARHGRLITVEADPGLRAVVDRTRLRQALSNLIDNALRHGGGTISLRAWADQQLVHVDVSDEGPGFGPDIAERAFERFVRGEQARSARGAGLGLAIVHTILDAHGGTVAIVGGLPTTVRMTLPA